MKILQRMGRYALQNVAKIGAFLNQLPDRKAKIPKSPHHQEKKYPLKGPNPQVERIKLNNHRRDRKPKGPPHSETIIFNHPRG